MPVRENLQGFPCKQCITPLKVPDIYSYTYPNISQLRTSPIAAIQNRDDNANILFLSFKMLMEALYVVWQFNLLNQLASKFEDGVHLVVLLSICPSLMSNNGFFSVFTVDKIMVLKVDDGSLNFSGCTTLEISFKQLQMHRKNFKYSSY